MLSFCQGLIENLLYTVELVILHTQRVNRTNNSESIINSAKFICSNLICFPIEKVSINRLLICDKWILLHCISGRICKGKLWENTCLV